MTAPKLAVELTRDDIKSDVNRFFPLDNYEPQFPVAPRAGTTYALVMILRGINTRLAVKRVLNHDLHQNNLRMLAEIGEDGGGYVQQCISSGQGYERYGIRQTYIITDYYDYDLSQRLDRNPRTPFTIEELLEISHQLLVIADILSDKKVVHRDITPSNIVFQKLHVGFRVKLVGFEYAAKTGIEEPHLTIWTRTRLDRNHVEYGPPSQASDLLEIGGIISHFSSYPHYHAPPNTSDFRYFLLEHLSDEIVIWCETTPPKFLLRDFMFHPAFWSCCSMSQYIEMLQNFRMVSDPNGPRVTGRMRVFDRLFGDVLGTKYDCWFDHVGTHVQVAILRSGYRFLSPADKRGIPESVGETVEPWTGARLKRRYYPLYRAIRSHVITGLITAIRNRLCHRYEDSEEVQLLFAGPAESFLKWWCQKFPYLFLHIFFLSQQYRENTRTLADFPGFADLAKASPEFYAAGRKALSRSYGYRMKMPYWL